jgi:ABC-type phosphonate transport system ATPase subunit
MIRRIRDLLYDQGFTISGARNKLQEIVQTERDKRRNGEVMLDGVEEFDDVDADIDDQPEAVDFDQLETSDLPAIFRDGMSRQRLELVRRELTEIRDLLAA